MFSLKKLAMPAIAAVIGIGFMGADMPVSEAAHHVPPPPHVRHMPPPPPPVSHNVKHVGHGPVMVHHGPRAPFRHMPPPPPPHRR